MSYSCALEFDTDAADFVRGFEAGCLWRALQDDPHSVDGQPFHASNVELVMRMIASLEIEGVTATFVDGDETWMVLRHAR